MLLDLLHMSSLQIDATQVAHSQAQDNYECQACDHVVHGIPVRRWFCSRVSVIQVSINFEWLEFLEYLGESVYGSNG